MSYTVIYHIYHKRHTLFVTLSDSQESVSRVGQALKQVWKTFTEISELEKIEIAPSFDKYYVKHLRK